MNRSRPEVLMMRGLRDVHKLQADGFGTGRCDSSGAHGRFRCFAVSNEESSALNAQGDRRQGVASDSHSS